MFTFDGLIDTQVRGKETLLTAIGDALDGVGAVLIDLDDEATVIGTASTTRGIFKLVNSIDENLGDKLGIVFVYNKYNSTDPIKATDHSWLRAVVDTAMDTEKLFLLDALVRKGNRYASSICSDVTCCPPEGVALPKIELFKDPAL